MAEPEYVPRVSAILEYGRMTSVARKTRIAFQHGLNERAAKHERAGLGTAGIEIEKNVGDVASHWASIGCRRVPPSPLTCSHAHEHDAVAAGSAGDDVGLSAASRRSVEAELRQPIEDIVRRRRVPIHEPSPEC
jgi:hypothetical protein